METLLLVFHNGCLVRYPTLLLVVITLLWLSLGFVLAVLCMAAGILPMSWGYFLITSLGMQVMIKGRPSAGPLQLILDKNNNKLAAAAGVLFICSHRILLAPIFFSVALGCCITAITYSNSQFSEMVSPVKTVALTHNKEQDATNIHKLLAEGDLTICLEGTTCCEPFVLYFSSLFAEFTYQIIPVAVNNRNSIFHGTTGTGCKCRDPFFFFMNLRPVHEISFLTPLPRGLTYAAGKLPNDFANYTHRILAATMEFKCTNLTHKDKYRVIVANDGTIPLRTTPSILATISSNV